MTDKELLELAAKAAGINGDFVEKVTDWDSQHRGGSALQIGSCSAQTWNPLTDDGDALRLAVKLKINIQFSGGLYSVSKRAVFDVCCEFEGEDTIRRAITFEAAQIGEAMK